MSVWGIGVVVTRARGMGQDLNEGHWRIFLINLWYLIEQLVQRRDVDVANIRHTAGAIW